MKKTAVLRKIARAAWSTALVLVLITVVGNTGKAEDASMLKNIPVHQLRIYEIFDHNKQAFHERFRDHAARIMEKYGFTILEMWEARNGDKTEFVYLLQWPDEESMRRQWAAFMADTEWAEIKRATHAVHGGMVGAIQEKVMWKVIYSPR